MADFTTKVKSSDSPSSSSTESLNSIPITSDEEDNQSFDSVGQF